MASHHDDGIRTVVTAQNVIPTPVWRRKLMWIPLILGAVAGLAGGLAWSLTSDAGYEANGTVFVAFAFPPDEKDPFSAAQFVRQRIDSYAQLGQSSEVLQAVADDVGSSSGSDLVDRVTVQSVPGTVLLRITVEDRNSETSLRLANSVMSKLDDAVEVVESGGPDAISPVGLVPIQPAISAPMTMGVADLLIPAAALAAGAILGAAIGWILCRRRPLMRSSPAPTRSSGGRHRNRTTPSAAR